MTNDEIENKRKATEIAQSVSFFWTNEEDDEKSIIDAVSLRKAIFNAVFQAMQMKDEQHEKEKQQLIKRTIDWVQKEATKHIGFNAISEECSLSWDFTDLLVKAMKGE